jgi:Ca2+-binding RTX toxin-like protein
VLNSRRKAAVATVAALSLTVPLLGTSPATAAAPVLPGDVSDVRVGLIKLGGALASAAEQPALSDDLPLTDTSVRDVLNLDTAIGTLVDDALSTKTDTTLDTLDDAFPAGGALTVKEVDSSAGAPANSREWTMTVALEAARPVALAYQDPAQRLELGTATLDGDLAASLDATIRFRYDPDALELRKFAVVGSTQLTTHVWTSDDGADGDVERVDVPAFTVVDGFVELDASGAATIDSTTVLTLRDPNGRGQITTEDLEFSSASELFTTTTAPGADDVAIDIDLSTPMEGSATGSITVGDRPATATTTYAVPEVDRSDALDDLSSLTRLQAITGFTQYTSALQAVEATVDQQFPLLDLSLTDIFSPGSQLLDLLTEQATASVVCGAADTSPPSGAPRPGQVRYCQAVTSSFEPKAGETITWESPDAGVDISGSTAGTVGRAPTENVLVEGGDGFPTLRVGFTAEDGTKRHARSAVTSIQDLGRAIDKLGLDGEVSYDASKQSLEVAVRNSSGSAERTVPTGGNGNLAPLTGLSGLCQAAKGTTPRVCKPTGDTADGGTVTAQEGSATVTVDGRSFGADFGIGLAEAAEPVEGQPAPTGPTFYLRPGDGGVVYQVDEAKATLAKDAPMVARVGFLQVDVDVTDYAVSQNGKAASVSVPTGTVDLPSEESVSDVVAIADLLAADPADAPTVERGLTAKATLAVKDSAQDSAGTRPVNASGTVKAEWGNLLPTTLPSVTTQGDYDKLRLLDIVPARQGVMDAGTGDGVIKDADADFLDQFGLTAAMSDEESTVTRPLYDLGVPGASSTICSMFVVVAADEVRCTEGPLSEDDVAAEGHAYVIDGDQDALRDIVIEDLAAVLNSFSTPDPALGTDKTFPLVDVLPTEISAARDGLGKAITGVQDLVDNPDATRGVSSMQEFTATLDTLLGSAVSGQDSETARKLGFTLSSSGPTRLVLESSLATKGTRDAPLRVATEQSEVKVTNAADDVATVPVDVASKAKFVIGIDLADASSQVRADSGTAEQITTISGGAAELARVKKTLEDQAADYGSARVRTGAAADIKIGIGVNTVTSPQGSDDTWIDIADLPAEMEQTRSVDGAAQTCGGTVPDPSKIAACLELPIVSDPATAPVLVALTAEESSGGAGGSVKAQPIAYRFLGEALAGLNLTLADALDGDQTVDPDTGAPLSLPLIGTNLDAGADVVADVDRYVSTVRSALKPVETAVAETDAIPKLDTELKGALATVTTQLASKHITAAAGAPTFTCSAACAGKNVDDVQKIAVPVVLKGTLPAPQQVPFQAGPAGSTIVTDLTVPVTTTWTLKVTVGIGRGTGPFVKLGDATPADPLLKVDVEAQLPKYDAATCHSWARQSKWQAKLKPAAQRDIKNVDVAANQSAGAECIDAFVGKFPSVMVDREKNGERGTFLDASVVVDVVAPDGTGADGLVYLPTLYDKSATFETTATGDGAISTYFESFALEAGFFDVVGTLDLAWKDGEYGPDGLQYGLLMIDVESLNKAVFPGFKKALAWTAPLNPVVDQLAKPIPVVTNLSELVGQGPVTLLTLLQKKNTPINLIVNLLQMQNIAAAVPEGESDLREIGGGGLGGFKVEPYKLGVGGKCTETGTAGGKPFERSNGGKGDSGRCKLGNFDKMKQYVKGEKPEKDPAGLKVDKTVTKSPYLSLPSVSVPVLQDTSQIFGLLQDTGDATMLYVDLGHAGVTGQIVRSFGPFAVGPIPVTATIGGTVGLDGRFAFGFDTRGLSKKIETLDTGDIGGFDKLSENKPSLFSDGFYIDDLEKGVDVPEIQLTFTVQAGAAISIGIVEAGIAGGATLDLSLDAFDPNGDGKIYTDEFAGTSTGPACAFNVSSGISFFLQFYFSIELVFYTLRKSFDIARSPRLKLFEFNCETVTPTLAVEKVESGKNVLVLTMGTAASERKGFTDEKAEKYTVRQIGAPANGKMTLQVSAFNLVENHVVPVGTVVKADGDIGSDTVRLYPMPAVTTNDQNEPSMAGPGDAGYVAPVFTAAADISGGSGSDTIETSDGDDVVDGDDGDDSIRTGGGDDRLTGGSGLDQLDGGQGTDRIAGGAEADRLNGGPGADELRGDAGDDVLDGGIGAAPDGLFPVATATAIRPLLDAGDLVVGGDGADTVNGGDGSDVVIGGAYDTTPAAFTAKDSVTVDAMDANRKILRVTVNDIPTVTVPDDDTVRTQCTSPGASGETGPDDVTGGADRDIVMGGAGDDTLAGGGGKDVVCGRAGDDLLDGDGTDVDAELQADDTVRGGPGRDRLYGSGGKDDLAGDLGDDLVRGGDGGDTIAGGAGSDLLLGEAGIDTVAGDNADGAAEVAADPDDASSTGRSIVCSTSTSVVGGRIDLDGDLAGDDDGQLEGMSVVGGVVEDASGDGFDGTVDGVVLLDGEVDLDGNGVIEARTATSLGDTGSIPLAGITGAAGNGDCVLGGDEVDASLIGGAGADYVDAGGGDDIVVHGGTGNDLVRGGDGKDLVHGDAGDDLVAGDAGDDVLFGNADDDVLRGGSGQDLLAGGSSVADAIDGADEVLGDGGDDVVLGGNATLSRTAPADTAIPGVGITLLGTPTTTGRDDLAYGGDGDDWVFAQEGDDEAYGGPGTDVVEGGPGSDRVQGDDEDDLLVGGSSTTGAVTTDRSAAGTDDGDDTMVGDDGVDSIDGSDVMVGDNARVQIVARSERSRWNRVRNDVAIDLFDVPADAGPAAVSPDSSGDDTLRGGGKDDLVLAQSGDDVVSGGDGADAIEGGAGGDTVTGGAGDDEIVGGSWTVATLDGGDTLSGDDGADLLLGDNGNPANGFAPYVTLLDAPASGRTSSAAVSGGDVLSGGDGEDRAYGQGGDDTLAGDAGVDVLEGDAGGDQLSGGSEDDVLTGGSSSDDGVISPGRTATGQLDAADGLSGGSGDDVLAGDNARLDTTSARRADGTRLRSVLLFDLATAGDRSRPGTGGGDTLIGDDGRDLLFGQTGDDSVAGGTGDDYLEGNDGADSLGGGDGEDDVLGGGSSRTGAVITVSGPLAIDRLLTAPTKPTDVTASGLLDGNDELDGGDARDVLLGDNGRITRGGPNTTLSGGASGTHVVRQVAMADKLPGSWSGSDRLTGGAGDDDLYGQLDNTRTKRPGQAYAGVPAWGDVLVGGGGDDALIGDQGVDVPTRAAALGAVGVVVKDNKSFLREPVRPRGSLVRVVTLTQASIGGDDVLVGNEGDDSIHAGAGKDVVNAGSGADIAFTGDGNDAVWGGAGHDRLFGGAGNDLLDVKRRSGDSPLWRVVAPIEDTDRLKRTNNGRDVLHGGAGADALQADQGDAGSARRYQGDRLIDWRAKVNVFKTCRSGYGPGKVLDESSSSMVKTLKQLATASGSVGSSELAIPSRERLTRYPGNPKLVCETR